MVPWLDPPPAGWVGNPCCYPPPSRSLWKSGSRVRQRLFKINFNCFYALLSPNSDFSSTVASFPVGCSFPVTKAQDPSWLRSLTTFLYEPTLTSGKQRSRQAITQAQSQDKDKAKAKAKAKTKQQWNPDLYFPNKLSGFLLCSSSRCNKILCLLTVIF